MHCHSCPHPHYPPHHKDVRTSVVRHGEGNGTPLQYSCLENPMDGGAWWAAVHGVLRVGHDWVTSLSLSLSCIGEGNGNPLQCSCLVNPRDGGAWWAAVYGVTQSQTRLKWLSSSSMVRHISGLAECQAPTHSFNKGCYWFAPHEIVITLMIILWLILSFLRRKENSTITTTSINSNSNTYWGINMWYKLFWALLLINPVNPQNNAVRWVLLSPGFYKWGNQGMESWSHLARSHGWDVEELQFQPWDSGPRVYALKPRHMTWGQWTHFTDEEAEAQKNEITCPGSHSLKEESLGLDSGGLVLVGASLTLVLWKAWPWMILADSCQLD